MSLQNSDKMSSSNTLANVSRKETPSSSPQDRRKVLVCLMDAKSCATPPSSLRKEVFTLMREMETTQNFHDLEIKMLTEEIAKKNDGSSSKEREELSDLRRSISDFHSLLSDSNKEVADMRRRLGEQDLDSLVKQKGLEKEIHQLKTDLKLSTSEVEELRKDRQDFEFRIQMMNQHHTKEIDRLQMALQDAQGTLTEKDLGELCIVRGLEDQISVLTRKNRELGDSLLEKQMSEDVKEKSDDINSDINVLAEMLAVGREDLFGEVKKLLEAGKFSENELRIIKSDRDLLLENICAKTLELCEVKKKHETEMSDLQKRISSMEAGLKEQIDGLNKEKVQLHDLLNKETVEMEELQKKWNDSKLEYEGENGALRVQLEELKMIVRMEKESVGNINEAKSVYEKETKELISRLENERDEVQKFIEVEKARSSESITKFNVTKSEYEQQLKELKMQLSEKDEEIDKLCAAGDVLRCKSEVRVNEMQSEHEKEIKELKTEWEEKQNELTNARNTLEGENRQKLEETTSKYEKMIHELEAVVKAQKSEVEELLAQMENLKTDVRECENGVEELKTEGVNVKEEVEDEEAYDSCCSDSNDSVVTRSTVETSSPARDLKEECEEVNYLEFAKSFGELLVSNEIASQEEVVKAPDFGVFYVLLDKHIILLDIHKTLQSEFEEFRRELDAKTLEPFDKLDSLLSVDVDRTLCELDSSADFSPVVGSSTLRDPLSMTIMQTPLRSNPPNRRLSLLKSGKLRHPTSEQVAENDIRKLEETIAGMSKQIDQTVTSHSNQIVALGATVEKKLLEAGKLDKRIVVLEDLASLYSSENESLSGQIKSLEAALRQSNLQLEELREKLLLETGSLRPGLQLEISDLPLLSLCNKFIETIMDNCEELKNELDVAKEEGKEWRTKAETSQVELREQDENKKKVELKIAEIKETVEVLNRELVQVRKQKEDFEGKVEVLRNQAVVIEKERDDLKDYIVQLESESEEVQSKMSVLDTENVLYQEKVKTSDATHRDLRAAKEELDKEISKLRDSFEDVQVRKLLLEKETVLLLDKISGLENDLREALEGRKQLQENTAAVENSKSVIHEANLALQSMISHLENQVRDTDEAKSLLSKTLQQLTDKINELENEKLVWVEEKTNLSNSISHSVEELTKVRNHSEVLCEKNLLLQGTVSSLEAQLVAAQVAKDSLSGTLEQLKNKVSQFENEKLVWDKEKSILKAEDLRDKILELGAQLSSANDDKEQLTKTLDELKDKVSQFEKEKLVWDEEKTSLSDNILKEEEAKILLTKMLEQLTDKMNELEKEKFAWIEEKTNLSTRMSKNEVELASMKNSSEELIANIVELKEKQKKMDENNTSLQTTISDLRKTLFAVTKAKEELSDEVLSLKNEIERMKNKDVEDNSALARMLIEFETDIISMKNTDEYKAALLDNLKTQTLKVEQELKGTKEFYTTKLNHLKKEFWEIEQQRTALVEKNAWLVESVAKLELNITNVTKEKDLKIDELVETLVGLETKVTELTEDRDLLSSNVSDLKSLLEEVQKVKDELFSDLEKLKTEIEGMEEIKKEVELTNTELKAELARERESCNVTVNKITEDIEKAREALGELETKNTKLEKENATLGEKVRNLKSEMVFIKSSGETNIEQCGEEIELLKQVLSKVEERNKELEDLATDLMTKNKESVMSLQDLEEKGITINAKLLEAETHLKEVMMEMGAMQLAADKSKEEGQVLEEQVVVLNIEIKKLTTLKESCDSEKNFLSEKLCESEACADHCRQELETAAAQIRVFQTELKASSENYENIIKDLNGRLEVRTNEVGLRELEMRDMRTEMNLMRGESEAKAVRTSELELMVASLNEDLKAVEAKVGELETSHVALNVVLEQKVAHVAQLNRELLKMEQNNTSLLKILLEIQKAMDLPDCTILNDLDNCHVKFTDKIKSLKDLENNNKEQMRALEQELEKMNKEILVLRTDVEVKSDKINELQSKIITLESDLTKHDGRNKNFSVNSRRIDKLEELNGSLNAMICRVIEVTKHSNPEIFNFSSVRSHETSSKALLGHVTQLVNEVDKLKENNKVLDEENEEMSGMLKDFEKENCVLKNKVFTMGEESKSKEEALEAKCKEIEKLKIELAAVQKELQTLRSSPDRGGRRKSDLFNARKMEKLEEQNKGLSDALKRIARAVEHPEPENLNLATLRGFEATVRSIEERLAGLVELRAQNQQLDEENEDMVQTIKDFEKKNSQLILENLKLKETQEGEQKSSVGCSCGSELIEIHKLLNLKEQRILELQQSEREYSSLKSQINYLENALDKAERKYKEEKEKVKKFDLESKPGQSGTSTSDPLKCMRGSLSGGLVQETAEQEKMLNLVKKNAKLKELCRDRLTALRQLESEVKALKGNRSPLMNSPLVNSPAKCKSYNTRSQVVPDFPAGFKLSERRRLFDKENK